MRRIFALASILASSSALGQERPSESDLFGAPAAQAQPAPDPAAERPAEAALFGGPAADDHAPAPAREVAPSDPLKVGGQLYLRSQMVTREGQPPSDWMLSAPTLFDGYFDARPNDRVRGLVLGRLRFDPTVDSSRSLPVGPKLDGGPTVALDQFWLRFDIARRVFVTAGRQHVKWGVGHFWNPTDFLHPTPRDPLAVFDARTGVTMLKLHLPWEQKGWNLYAVGFLEGIEPASTVGRVGGAARAEIVLGTAELGLDVVAQRGTRTKMGIDLSAGIGDVDFYAEAKVQKGSDRVLWRPAADPDPTRGVLGQYEPFTPDGYSAAAVAGASWSHKYSDEDACTLGGEYFYNSLGYENAALYPWLLFQSQFTPFYLGKHYLGLFAMLPNPGSWNNTSFTLSHLANLSDRSAIARLDYSVVVLTHLRLEAFGAYHYGQKGGEFRLGLDIPAQQIGGQEIPAIVVPAPVFELGVGLRVSI